MTFGIGQDDAPKFQVWAEQLLSRKRRRWLTGEAIGVVLWRVPVNLVFHRQELIEKENFEVGRATHSYFAQKRHLIGPLL